MHTLQKMDSQTWKEYSQKSHIVVFGENRTPDLDRIDYVILMYHNNEVGGFVTIKEMDSETAYIQHGGAYPSKEKSLHVAVGYKKMIKSLQNEYKYITTKIENTNVSMLKLALSVGFLIKGSSVFKDKVFLDLSIGG